MTERYYVTVGEWKDAKLLVDVDDDTKLLKADALRTVRLYVEEWFGERCEEFEPNCICCRKWQAFDELFKGPEE